MIKSSSYIPVSIIPVVPKWRVRAEDPGGSRWPHPVFYTWSSACLLALQRNCVPHMHGEMAVLAWSFGKLEHTHWLGFISEEYTNVTRLATSGYIETHNIFYFKYYISRLLRSYFHHVWNLACTNLYHTSLHPKYTSHWHTPLLVCTSHIHIHLYLCILPTDIYTFTW